MREPFGRFSRFGRNWELSMSYLELARKALEKCPRINPTDVPMANPQCDESDQSDKSPLACPAAQGQEGEPRGTLAEADADEVEGRYWYPPPEIPLCFQD